MMFETCGNKDSIQKRALLAGGRTILVALSASALLGCSDGSTASGAGTVNGLLESEDVIINGLKPGDGLEHIQDGWSISFDKYLVQMGQLTLRHTTESDVIFDDERSYVVDLAKSQSNGASLWRIDDMPKGRYDVAYSVAATESIQHESVESADFDRMTDENLSHLIVGTLSQSGGQSCPPASLATPDEGMSSSGQNAAGDDCYDNEEISFSIPAKADTRFGPCEIDGISGVSVGSSGQTSVALTIHGDHIFFNGFPESAESGIMRLAQWLADCDLNLDGKVTTNELEAIHPSDLSEIDSRYQLGGSPITPLDDMLTYWRAQLMTQGHFQGEGECALGPVEE